MRAPCGAPTSPTTCLTDLIAQRPPIERSGSRLLHLERATSRVHDLRFTDLPVAAARRRPARVQRHARDSGACRRQQADRRAGRDPARARARRTAHPRACAREQTAAQPTCRSRCPAASQAHFIGRRDDLFELELSTEPLPYFERHGSMPLPPYIERRGGSGRCDALSDDLRARTRRSRCADGRSALRRSDARALPRAGRELGVRDAARRRRDFSAGARRRSRPSIACTPERVTVSAEVCAAIERTRAAGRASHRSRHDRRAQSRIRRTRRPSSRRSPARRGCSSRRASVSRSSMRWSRTSICPESTLLMLVCAFGGYDAVMQAYRHAVSERYRFFSYGDAMFLERGHEVRAAAAPTGARAADACRSRAATSRRRRSCRSARTAP